MITNSPLPGFAIVIEWENARHAELARPRAMLRALHSQVSALRSRLPAPPQIMLLYDHRRVDPAIIRSAAAEAFGEAGALCDLRIEPVEDCGYYALKNAGAVRTTGDILILLDSDVVPQPGWLKALLESFADGAVDIACGQTYMSLHSVYSRCFALFWFFGTRVDRVDLAPSAFFFANNVAFRRDVFMRHPFPPGDLYRGNCLWLADALRKAGVRIFRQHRAEVTHPPPAGLREFVVRALWEGHDDVKITQHWSPVTWRQIARRYVHSVRDMARRTAAEREKVGLGSAGAVGALALGWTYHTLKLLGAATTRAQPQMLRRLLPT